MVAFSYTSDDLHLSTARSTILSVTRSPLHVKYTSANLVQHFSIFVCTGPGAFPPLNFATASLTSSIGGSASTYRLQPCSLELSALRIHREQLLKVQQAIC